MLAEKLRAATASANPAWNLANATYQGAPVNRFYVGQQEINPSDIFFKPDGLKMYVVGAAGDDVNEYTLSTAWDISTASYLQNFSVAAQEINPSGLFFKPDGLKMYVVGTAGDDVNEYTLSTAWNISTASYLQVFSLATANPSGIFFKPDGLKMYVISAVVDEYNLSTAWDVSTASYLQNFSVAAQDTVPRGLYFKPDGLKMYVVGDTSDFVYEYDVGTAWNISTAFYAYPFTDYFSVATEETNPRGIFFKPDGFNMYVIGSTGDDVNQYSLSVAWDIATASYVQNFSIAAQETEPRGLSFKPDGTKMYFAGSTGDDVNEYTLSTAWDISTASYVQNFSFAAQETGPTSFFFKPDGLKMYVLGATGDDVNEYTLSTAWDISTASYTQNFSIAAQDTTPTGLFFRPNGLQMYMVGQTNDNVYEYSLTTPWDISTASYLQNFSVFLQESAPTCLFFKFDGLKMYVAGTSQDAVFSYDFV